MIWTLEPSNPAESHSMTHLACDRAADIREAQPPPEQPQPSSGSIEAVQQHLQQLREALGNLELDPRASADLIHSLIYAIRYDFAHRCSDGSTFVGDLVGPLPVELSERAVSSAGALCHGLGNGLPPRPARRIRPIRELADWVERAMRKATPQRVTVAEANEHAGQIARAAPPEELLRWSERRWAEQIGCSQKTYRKTTTHAWISRLRKANKRDRAAEAVPERSAARRHR